MLLSKVLFFGAIGAVSFVSLHCGSVKAAPGHAIDCPASIKEGHKERLLANVQLFDGDPSELASLVPDSEDETVWTITPEMWAYQKKEGRDMFLVCSYKGAKNAVTLKVPADTPKCTMQLHRHKFQGFCN